MNDERIIKANHCCLNDGSCANCPYFVEVDKSNCRQMCEDTLDLIHRYQAENKHLKALLKKRKTTGTPFVFAEKLKDEILLLLAELYNQRNERLNEIEDADFVYIDMKFQIKVREISLLQRVLKMIDDIIEKTDGENKC